MPNYGITHFSDSSEDDSVVVLQSKLNHSARCQYKTEKSDEDVSIGGINSKNYLTEISDVLTGQVSKIPSVDFYNYYSNNFHQTSLNPARSLRAHFSKSPLPICVRYQSTRCVVIERPPFKVPVRISYRNSRSIRRSRTKDDKGYECEIWIPWSLLVIVSSNGFGESLKNSQLKSYLFFRDGPLTSFNDLVAIPYTPNIYGDGNMCMGQSFDDLRHLINTDQIDPSNISQIYHNIITEYFSGGWNLDLGINGVFHYFDKLFTKKNVKEIIEKAEVVKNKYILSLQKKYGKYGEDLNIAAHDVAGKMRFFFNYLSMLNLEESFELFRKILDFQKDSNFNHHYDDLHHLLKAVDPDYSSEYAYLNQDQLDDVHDMIYSSEENRSTQIVRRSISSNKNAYSLHSWSIRFIYNVDDFLNYASHLILSNNTRYLWDFSGYDRECFYKKNIKNFIFLGESSMQYVFQDYVRELYNKHESILTLVKNSILELSNYYRSEYKNESSSSYKKSLIIDLSQHGIVLDESVLKEKESVVL